MSGNRAPRPFWGLQTSAVNFCEEDYAITRYAAEFFNVLTSLTYVCYGVHGIRRLKRRDIGVFNPVNSPYWALIGVGIFSSGYHLTLKYHTQMADEMSMHLAMGCVLIQVFNFEKPPTEQKRNTAIIVGGLTAFIVYHCVTDEFIMHVILFFTLSVSVIYKTRRIIKQQVRNPTQREMLSSLASLGSAAALTAYGLWNVDVHFCPQLTALKKRIGMPGAVLFELHGWWHILTAIAAYTFMAMIEFLTCPEHDETHGVGFAWPAKAVLQDLVPSTTPSVTSNGTVVNGNGYVERTEDKKHS